MIHYRTLIKGDSKAGFSIFWADDGLDTGPILLQRTCDVTPQDTLDTLYNRFLYPEGITAMVGATFGVLNCATAVKCYMFRAMRCKWSLTVTHQRCRSPKLVPRTTLS